MDHFHHNSVKWETLVDMVKNLWAPNERNSLRADTALNSDYKQLKLSPLL